MFVVSITLLDSLSSTIISLEVLLLLRLSHTTDHIRILVVLNKRQLVIVMIVTAKYINDNGNYLHFKVNDQVFSIGDVMILEMRHLSPILIWVIMLATIVYFPKRVIVTPQFGLKGWTES